MDQNQSKKQRPPVTEETGQATATAHEDTPTTPSPAKASTAKARPAPKAEASAPKASASKPKSEKSAPAVRTSTTADAPRKVAKEAPKVPAKEKAAASAQVGIRSERPAHRVIPYLLLLLAAFLLVCLTLNLFCNLDNQLADDPSAHWMGRIGYHICYGLFGMLGGAAFALPVLLLNLAFYWKKYVDNRLLTSKLISAVLIQLLLSAVVHVFCLAGLQNPALRELPADVLLAQGVQMRGGGLIGGGIGFFLTQYLNVVGSLIVGFLLLIALFFYFLGMTPHHLWARFRLYLAVKKEQSAEKAPREKKAKEEKKPSDDGEKDPEADLAPMPTPRISPDDEEHMFLPPDVSRKMREQELPSATEATPVAASAVNPAPTAPAAPATSTASAAPATTPAAASAPTAAPKPVTAPTAGKAPTAPTTASNAEKATPPTGAGAMAKNRDAAVEPIFPRTQEPRPTRRIPREDRNFDLKKVFIDFDDEMPMPTRKHAPLPPEKPMPGSRPQARTAPTAGAASNASRPATRPASAGTAASAATPVRTNAPQIGRMPNAPAQTEASRPASAVKTTSAASAPKIPTTANASKPIFRQAETSAKKDFGLSNEEFEKLEQARPDLSGKKPSADASKKAAAKPVAPKKPDTAKPITAKRYTFPPISYLHPAEPMTAENRAEIDESMRRLADALESFRVRVQEINYSCGPTVTRYEIILAPGVRVRSVTNLANDIALALRSSGGVRIEAPIPGTNAVGIEVPNKTRSTIYLRDLIESKVFTEAKSKLSACLGADIAGEPIIFDIAKMPHLLVAGTTGSGKSVCINCIIMSILYKARPDEVKLVLIDPKKVEFSVYKNIPHLMAPVVTAPKDAAGALQAAVEEMEHRFEIFEAVHVRFLGAYELLPKGLILLFVHGAVYIICRSLVVTALPPGLFHIHRLRSHQGCCRIEKVEIILAKISTDVFRKGIGGQRAGSDDHRAFRHLGDLLFYHGDIGMAADLIRHHFRKAFPVYCQAAARFYPGGIGAGHDQAVKPPQFFL